MTTLTEKTKIFKSINLRVPTPDGVMYLVVIEDAQGNVFKIDVNAGKCGSSFMAWSQAFCDLLSIRLANKETTIPDIINFLSDYNTDRVRMGSDKLEVKSGPHGIKIALLKYLQFKSSQNDSGRESNFPRIPFR